MMFEAIKKEGVQTVQLGQQVHVLVRVAPRKRLGGCPAPVLDLPGLTELADMPDHLLTG